MLSYLVGLGRVLYVASFWGHWWYSSLLDILSLNAHRWPQKCPGTCSKDDSHCCSGRGTLDIDPATINRPSWRIVPDSVYYVGNCGRFPPITKLVCKSKPVPTKSSVSFAGLLRIRNDEPVFLCQLIHTYPSGEIHRRLRTSVYHESSGTVLPTW